MSRLNSDFHLHNQPRQSRQKHLYLPEPANDFIFAVIGEELGLIGAILCMGLLFTLVLRCIYISTKAKDKFGKYIAAGVAFMFMAHIFENIGMCVGLMPVTGIPLPFISYGGTAMLINYLAFGVILNISMSRNT